MSELANSFMSLGELANSFMSLGGQLTNGQQWSKSSHCSSRAGGVTPVSQ